MDVLDADSCKQQLHCKIMVQAGFPRAPAARMRNTRALYHQLHSRRQNLNYPRRVKRFLKSPRPHRRQRNGGAARRKISRERQHLLAPYPFAENSEFSHKSSTRIDVFGIREPAIGDHCRRRAVRGSAGASSRIMDS
jgi:hypothetical protein